MFRSALLGLLLLPALARGDAPGSFSADMRYVSSTTLPDTVEGTSLLDTRLFPWLLGGLGARVAGSSQDWERFDYKVEGRVPLFGFLVPEIRVTQSNYLSQSAASTTFLFTAEISGRPLPFLEGFVLAGWYERSRTLSKALILPTSWNGVHDHDFAALFGIRVLPASGWRIIASAGTFEEIDVYNLNNPYFGLETGYRPSAATWTLRAYARYQVLLGFGRLDEIQAGIGLKWDWLGPLGHNP